MDKRDKYRPEDIILMIALSPLLINLMMILKLSGISPDHIEWGKNIIRG